MDEWLYPAVDVYIYIYIYIFVHVLIPILVQLISVRDRSPWYPDSLHFQVISKNGFVCTWYENLPWWAIFTVYMKTTSQHGFVGNRSKRRQPKRRQIKTSTNQNVNRLKLRQTNTSTNQNVDRPKRQQTQTSPGQNVDTRFGLSTFCLVIVLSFYRVHFYHDHIETCIIEDYAALCIVPRSPMVRGGCRENT